MKLEVGQWYWVKWVYDHGYRGQCVSVDPGKQRAVLRIVEDGCYAKYVVFSIGSFVSVVEPADIPDERPWWRRLFS